MKASTHDGRFHADEIFGLAVLNLIYPDLEIVGSRDENVYKNADIIVDVGHVKVFYPDTVDFFLSLGCIFKSTKNLDHVISDWTNKSKIAGYCIFPLANLQN